MQVPRFARRDKPALLWKIGLKGPVLSWFVEERPFRAALTAYGGPLGPVSPSGSRAFHLWHI